MWRLVTGHWTHWNLDHLFWDVGVLVGLGTACEGRNRRGFFLCVAISTIAIPAAIFSLSREVGIYRGLSGVDSALFSLLVVSVLLEKLAEPRWGWVSLGMVLLLGFVAKTGYEVSTGATVFVATVPGIAAVPLAHMVGAMVGIMTGLAPEVPTYLNERARSPEGKVIPSPR